MPKHEIEFTTGRLPGMQKHIVKAESRDAAVERIQRAYPKDKVKILTVNEEPVFSTSQEG